jgi:hypothetical protein
MNEAVVLICKELILGNFNLKMGLTPELTLLVEHDVKGVLKYSHRNFHHPCPSIGPDRHSRESMGMGITK